MVLVIVVIVVDFWPCTVPPTSILSSSPPAFDPALYLLEDLLQPQHLASVQDPQPLRQEHWLVKQQYMLEVPMPDSMLGRNLREVPDGSKRQIVCRLQLWGERALIVFRVWSRASKVVRPPGRCGATGVS